MIQEPDPTTPDPVEYIRAWIEYARQRLREKNAAQSSNWFYPIPLYNETFRMKDTTSVS